MTTKNIVYISLGSNLENPRRQVQTALAELSHIPQTSVISHSSLYKTKPVGPQDQPDFINACAALSTTLTPEALLSALQNIEQQHDRQRLKHWGPRTLDLDILLFGNLVTNTEILTIPHPQLSKRAFVIQPLAEIAPQLVLANGQSLMQLKQKLGSSNTEV